MFIICIQFSHCEQFVEFLDNIKVLEFVRWLCIDFV